MFNSYVKLPGGISYETYPKNMAIAWKSPNSTEVSRDIFMGDVSVSHVRLPEGISIWLCINGILQEFPVASQFNIPKNISILWVFWMLKYSIESEDMFLNLDIINWIFKLNI